jgi:corrinoid protein of di/trimethylamine methyltransferase
MSEILVESLKKAILNYDKESAKKVAGQAINEKGDLMKMINISTETIRVVGDKFSNGEIFLPHLIMASDAMKAAMEILQPHIPKEQLGVKTKVVIGTAKDDIHDIGKSIVSSMMEASGFEVYDLGKDIPEENFISKGEETSADILAVSALMTVTMPRQKELVKELERLGMRQKYKVLVGGGPVTKEWAEEIGADGTGKDAKEAVNVAKNLLG